MTVPMLPVGSDKGWWVEQAKWRLAGRNRFNENYHPGPINEKADGQFGRSCQRGKWYLGYPKDQCDPFYGPALHSFLVPRFLHHNDGTITRNEAYQPLPARYAMRRRWRQGKPSPFPEPEPPSRPWPFPPGTPYMLNGCPYQGTHNRGNWESDNAVDLNVKVGTPILAVWDGVIGPQWGPLSSSNPALFGNRLHVRRSDGMDSYYAHLSRLDVRPGARVKRGQRIGLSGSAAGVAHLHFSVTPPLRPDSVLLHPEWC